MTISTKKHIIGVSSEAYGANPSDDTTYKFRYKVLDLDDVIPSHTDSLAVNPNYPKELQPRIRERAASRMQIDNMAQNLNPKVLLRDTGFLDTGPMIIGSDNVVESGNGRMLALRKAMQEYPEKYRLYKTMLINQADKYGIQEDDIEGIKNPVLVRERITDVDRVKFAAEANTSNVLAMSPFEQAVQDAGRMPDSVIQSIEIGEDESIEQALRKKANAPIVARFFESIPANERATIVDQKGEINPGGMSRLKMALFTKTYSGEAGQRLARTFSETLDPNIKNIESAMFQSLPDMAKAESLVGTGARDKSLSTAPDIAKVVDIYAAIKSEGGSVSNFLKQSDMFEERLTPIQKKILEHLDGIARSSKKTREFIRDTAQRVIDAPAKGQTGMFGESFEITKERLINASVNKQRADEGQEPIADPPDAGTNKGLEKPGAERTGTMGEVLSGQKEIPGSNESIEMMPSTSVQTGLAGFGKESAQVEMFGEVSGKESKRETLVDVEKLKEAEANRPLPGQIELPTTEIVQYGDKVITPEGKVGIMHGSGGIGSSRVKVEGRGYYDREELKPASKYTPYELGKLAFERGAKAVPYHDKEFRETYITGDKVGDSTESSKQWIKGWHEANAKAPIEKKTHGVRYNAADIESAVDAAKRKRSDKTQYVFATAKGFRIQSDPPPGTQQYIEVKPDGSTKKVTFDDRLKEEEKRWQTKSGESTPVGDPRSAHAEAVDRGMTAKIVTEDANEWAKKRNRIDLEGFDTKRVTIRTVLEKEHKAKERPQFRINRKSSGAGRGIDLGGDIVKDRRGRHLRL